MDGERDDGHTVGSAADGTGNIDELAELRAELATMRKRLEHLEAQGSPGRPGTLHADAIHAIDGPVPTDTAAISDDSTDADADADESTSPVSRRHALRTAGVLAAGALAGGVASVAAASPAAAASGTFDGNPAVTANGGAFGVYATATGTALYVASSNRVMYASATNGAEIYATTGFGIYAASTTREGAYFVGHTVGAVVWGREGGLRFMIEGAAPSTRVTPQTAGTLAYDADENLWMCTVSGTPGTWRKLGGPGTSGSFHAVDPGRVYDSRVAQPNPGRISGGQNRTISVSAKRNPDTGAVTLADFVPAGATAVFANITVIDTAGSGYLAVNPGGITAVSASTINWASGGQTLANGVALKINASTRQVTVVAGGGSSCDFLIDITGYWM